MKKRIVATLLTTLLTAATMTGCGNNYTVALTDTNPVKVELGTEFSTDARDYITVTDGETTVENGEVFEEINLDITNVDVNAVGTYTVVITYEKNQLVIPVIVEDTTAPTIEAEDVALAEGTEVTVAEKAMKITLLDTVAPVIVAEDITIKVNDDIDLMDGISATDDVDGDLTGKVAVTGTVDTTKEGTYKVTYKVTDAAGNEAVAERTVTVEKKATPKKGKTTTTTTGGTTNEGGTVTGTTGGTTTGGNGGTVATPTTPAPAPAPTPAPSTPAPTPTTPTTPAPSNPPAKVDDIPKGDIPTDSGTWDDILTTDWDDVIIA